MTRLILLGRPLVQEEVVKLYNNIEKETVEVLLQLCRSLSEMGTRKKDLLSLEALTIKVDDEVNKSVNHHTLGD